MNDKNWLFENLLECCETKAEAFHLISKIPKHTALVCDYTGGQTSLGLYRAPLLQLKSKGIINAPSKVEENESRDRQQEVLPEAQGKNQTEASSSLLK
jgi:hypothetical protein